MYQGLANNSVGIQPDSNAGANRQHCGMNSCPMFSFVTVIGLFYGRQSRNNCEHGHRLMDSATNDKAKRYRESARKKVLVTVFAAARPVEFASIKLVRADDDQVAPHHAQETSNQFPAGDYANNAIKSDKETRYTQEHGDNRAGIDQSATGSYGLVRLRKIVDLRALRVAMRLIDSKLMSLDSSPNLNTRAVALPKPL